MYINQNSLEYKQFKDFEKYARFICEKFDVDIQLESNKAQTDGKIIYLPHVMSLTSEELDMMYAILLHEAGHIRYSNFDEKYFLSLKSDFHAFLANSIEDARIENLLLKDFGGAKDIFVNLYKNSPKHKKIMARLFNMPDIKKDLFTTFCFYVHNEMVEFDTYSIHTVTKKVIANKIQKFFEEEKVYKLLKEEYPQNDVDVINLTNKLYDKFLSYFKQKDTTNILKYKEAKEAKEKIEQLLHTMEDSTKQTDTTIQNLKEDTQNIDEQIKEFNEKFSDTIKELKEKIKSLENISENLQEKIFWHDDYHSHKAKLEKNKNSINKLNNDLKKLLEDKSSLTDKLNSKKNSRGQDLTEEQINIIEEKIVSKNEKIKQTEEKLTEKVKKQEELDKITQCFKNNLNQNPNLNKEEYTEQLKSINEELSSLKEQLNEINHQNNALENLKKENTKYIQKVQEKNFEKMTSILQEIQKINDENELDLDILPKKNYKDSWPEAATVQEFFDEKATEKTGKLVCNGEKGAGLFGTNVRDIMLFIEKKKEKVAEIDVLEIFKNKIHPCKFEEFNNEVKILNYMEDKSLVGVCGTYRKLLPFTTVFDSIKKENNSTELKEYSEILKENHIFFKNLKQVFQNKFKFARKDFWKGGKEEGDLDVRNLWKLPSRQGDDYFEISIPKFENKVAASILVDISGSQSKENTDYGKKIQSLVIGLSKALEEVHIKHEILGYHAPICEEMREMASSSIFARRSNRLETIVYKESKQKEPIGVMNMELKMSDNSDGESLRIAIKRLKAIKAKSHMIFIISDGKPFLSDTDISVLDEDFKAALQDARKEKVQVFGLGYFNQLGSFLGDRFCNTNFENNILQYFKELKF